MWRPIIAPKRMKSESHCAGEVHSGGGMLLVFEMLHSGGDLHLLATRSARLYLTANVSCVLRWQTLASWPYSRDIAAGHSDAVICDAGAQYRVPGDDGVAPRRCSAGLGAGISNAGSQ